jgi:cell division septation protein DedD
MRFLPALSLALPVVLLVAPAARADIPGCTYGVSPTVGLALDGPQDPLTQKPELEAHWAVNSIGECADNWQNVAQIKLYYTATGEKAYDGSADEIGQRQTGVTAFDDVNFIGARLSPVFNGSCFDPLQQSPIGSASGDPVIVPPFVDVPEHLTALQPPLSADPHYKGDVSQIPVGLTVKILGALIANPHGGEQAVYHIQGAGIDFAKAYDSQEGYQNDMDGAWVKPTQPGPIQIWIEFLGTTSEVRTLNAVAASSLNPSASPSPSTPPNPSTPPSPSTPASTPPAPSHVLPAPGCSMSGTPQATSGLFLMLLGAIVCARRVRVR